MRTLGVLLLCVCASAGAAERSISHGRFDEVVLYAPARDPEQLVLLLADTAQRRARLAKTLTTHGALVAAIDTRAFFAKLEADGADCVSPNGDLENLAHYVQALSRLPTYHTPILIGDGNGAAFVYAMLAQSASDTFAGGVSLKFCPQLALHKPLCKDHRLTYVEAADALTLRPAKLEQPWSALGTVSACAAAARIFVQHATHTPLAPLDEASFEARLTQAYVELARTVKPSAGAPPQAIADLPLIEVAAQSPGEEFAILLSGDGGWAGIDKQVAHFIAQQGISVVGLDSLRYFWSERTPDGLARDLTRIVELYAQRWHAKRVVLIGYSQGADVLPFAINRMRPKTRATIAATVLVGPGEQAMFEFHVGNWLGLDEDGLPLAPEMQRLSGTRVLCIYGEDDDDAKCESYARKGITLVKLPGGHHFNGDYAALARATVARSFNGQWE